MRYKWNAYKSVIDHNEERKMLKAVRNTKIMFLVIINLSSCDIVRGSINQPKSAAISGNNCSRNMYFDDFIAKLQKTTIYDTSMRPNYEGDALNVSAAISVISMDNMDLMSMDYRIDFYLYHEWNDKRLKHCIEEGIVLDEELYDKIWMPDTYIVNSKESSLHKVILDNKQIKISKNGQVKLSLRLTTRASCPIDLRSFPWDIQHCPLVMESYAYSDKEVRYTWSTVPMDKKNFAFASKMKELSQYSLVKLQFRNKQSQYAIGNWSTIEAVFQLRRKNGLYLLQTMGPSLITVIISWITFIIRYDQHPARISLGITSILTMEAIQVFIESSLPQVSYMTMLDVYSIMAYFFVYLAMIEYAFVLIVVEKGKSWKKGQATRHKVRSKKSRRETNSVIGTENATNVDEAADHDESETRISESVNQSFQSKFGQEESCLKTAFEIDYFARVFFPISFVLFNLSFWVYINTVIE